MAWNKKIELEKKIKHMGINEGVLTKGEMEEKLKLLNENIKYLELQELPEEMEEERDEEDGEDQKVQPKSSGNNRRSVDAIRCLEDQLGLAISTKNIRVMNYKDKMYVSKDELLKSKESAEQFVAKIKEEKKLFQVKMKKVKQKE